MGDKDISTGSPAPSDAAAGHDAEPQAGPGRPGRYGSRRFVVTAAVSLLCLAGAGATAAALSSGGNPAPLAAPGTGAAATRTAQPSASALPSRAASASAPSSSTGTSSTGTTGDGIAKTALQVPPASKSAAQHWEAGSAGAVLAAVTQDLGTVTQAAGQSYYPVVRRSCASLAANIRTAQRESPIPVPVMQTLYAKALTELLNGASSCQSAISERPQGDEGIETSENKAALSQALSELNAGAKGLYQATAQVQVMKQS